MIGYYLLRMIGGIISLLPYPTLHAVGRTLGVVIYYVHRPFRKKTMTNLAIAYGKTKSIEERRKIAKRSFQNLMITCLEFFRLKKSKGKLAEIVTMEGGEEVFKLIEKGQGIVFLTGHQANWEIPFIGLTAHAKGIAIGRPIKNKRLYEWVLSVREMNGGKIVMPRFAIKKGMEALGRGEFLGIVGDQAFPESSYSYPLFGTRAWTTSAPALIAYRTKSPLVVAMTKRVKGKYVITGSPLLWPDTTKPLKEEVVRLMDEAMGYLERSIQERPHEWMWQHDRWKQQQIDHVKRKYRYGFVLVVLPLEIDIDFTMFRKIYPRSFLTFLAPKGAHIPIHDVDVIEYREEKDLFLDDWRYQIVIDLYGCAKMRRHYRNLGAFQTLSLQKMKKISGKKRLEEIMQGALCKACP